MLYLLSSKTLNYEDCFRERLNEDVTVRSITKNFLTEISFDSFD